MNEGDRKTCSLVCFFLFVFFLQLLHEAKKTMDGGSFVSFLPSVFSSVWFHCLLAGRSIRNSPGSCRIEFSRSTTRIGRPLNMTCIPQAIVVDGFVASLQIFIDFKIPALFSFLSFIYGEGVALVGPFCLICLSWTRGICMCIMSYEGDIRLVMPSSKCTHSRTEKGRSVST